MHFLRIKMRKQIEAKLTALRHDFAQKDERFAENHSLLSGQSGMLLFELYYQRFVDKSDEKMENELVEMITSEIQSPIHSSTYCNGTAGFAWFLHHLNHQNFMELDEELFSQYDELIYQNAVTEFKGDNHDFLHGALGQLFYLVERFQKAPSVEPYLNQLLDLLVAAGTEHADGIFWAETPVMLDEEEKENYIINLHLSHGQAAKIMVLAKMVKYGLSNAKPVLEKAINYLLNVTNENQSDAVFPDRIVDGKKAAYSHMGWCRGNISIALALLNSAVILKNDELKTTAENIALHTLKNNTKEKARINDFALCHGTCGLVQMYNRLHEITGNEQFKAAADLWMTFTLAANHTGGISGFKSWNNHIEKWMNDYSLLSGAAGVGLALIGHISPENRAWDESFLLS